MIRQHVIDDFCTRLRETNAIMNALWEAVFAVVVICAFLASVRIAFVGLEHMPTNPWLAFISHDCWSLTLIVSLPWLIGAFARHEVSPLPWVAFSKAAGRHGPLDGVFTLLSVLTVELWLLWIPAHSYIVNRPGLDRRTATLARCLNLVIGLLLLTPQNPVYKILELFPGRDADDY